MQDKISWLIKWYKRAFCTAFLVQTRFPVLLGYLLNPPPPPPQAMLKTVLGAWDGQFPTLLEGRGAKSHHTVMMYIWCRCQLVLFPIYFFFYQELRIQGKQVTCGLLESFCTPCCMASFHSMTAYLMSCLERSKLQSLYSQSEYNSLLIKFSFPACPNHCTLAQRLFSIWF